MLAWCPASLEDAVAPGVRPVCHAHAVASLSARPTQQGEQHSKIRDSKKKGVVVVARVVALECPLEGMEQST